MTVAVNGGGASALTDRSLHLTTATTLGAPHPLPESNGRWTCRFNLFPQHHLFISHRFFNLGL